MGLMSARLRRLHYVWSWRIRYWWLDTRSGARARAAVFVAAAIVCAVQLLRMAARAWEAWQ